MELALFISNINTIVENNCGINEILGKFYSNDFNELIDQIKYILNNYFDELVSDKCFIESYHKFLYLLADVASSNDEIMAVETLIVYNQSIIRTKLKDYNKKIIEKDDKYNRLNLLNSNLDFNLLHVNSISSNKFNNGELFYETLKNIIFDLKDIDALFGALKDNPSAVNIKDCNNCHIFINIIRYCINNINKLSDEDKKFFKRVITMFLETNELLLSDEEIKEIVEELNYKSSNHDIYCIKKIIESHYLQYNKDARVNASDYCSINFPKNIVVKTNSKDFYDLRDLFTITIDSANKIDSNNMLYDDAFSLVNNNDGTHDIYVFVPDVDNFIDRDTDIDKFMRGLGNSVYKKENKKPLIEYSVAQKLSLKRPDDRYALTYKMTVDDQGNVKNIDFFRALIKVNYNLSINSANEFMKNNNDSKLDVLNDMFKISKSLSKSRNSHDGKRNKARMIMDEYNILVNLATAKFFLDNNIVFLYENYKKEDIDRKYIDYVKSHITDCCNDEASRKLLLSLLDYKKRVCYDTINSGNDNFDGRAYGNVGNTLREYISIETSRLIKDIIIDKLDNIDYWIERANLDCIQCTETKARIRSLYDK